MSIESQGIPRETSVIHMTRVGTYPHYAFVLTVAEVQITLSLEAVADLLGLLVMHSDETCAQAVHRGIRGTGGRDPGVLVAHTGASGPSDQITLAITVDDDTVVGKARRPDVLAVLRSATHRMADPNGRHSTS